jgi:hypothetical protein
MHDNYLSPKLLILPALLFLAFVMIFGTGSTGDTTDTSDGALTSSTD